MSFRNIKYPGVLLLSSLLLGCLHYSQEYPPHWPTPLRYNSVGCVSIAGRYYANSRDGERRYALHEMLLPEYSPYDTNPAWVDIKQSEEKIAVKLGSQNDVISNTILIRDKDYQCTPDGIVRNFASMTLSGNEVGPIAGGERRESIFTKAEDGSLIGITTTNVAAIGVLVIVPVPFGMNQHIYGRWLPIRDDIPLSRVYPGTILLFDDKDKETGEIEYDDEESRKFALDDIRKKAEKGNPKSQWILFRQVRGTPEDLMWLCRSADNGYFAAQIFLGDLYYKNSHFSREYLIHAYVWYELASRQQSGIKLERIDIITHMLTPEELVRAQQELAYWMPGQCTDDVIPTDMVQ